MSGVILEDATGGVIDEEKTVFAAHVSESESPDDVGSDGFNFVGLAPVDVGPARDTSGVEDVRGLGLRYVGYERGPVLETTGGIMEGDTLDPAEGAEEAPNPARAAVDEELDGPVGGGTVGWEAHDFGKRGEKG